MTSNEIKWLREEGKVGKCDSCLCRKPIEEMNVEMLPCNQYQCLVKLMQSEDTREDTQMVMEPMPQPQVVPQVVDKLVEESGLQNKFEYVARNELPVEFQHLTKSEKYLLGFVGKTIGYFEVIAFLGYEPKEVGEGCQNEGKKYLNYIYHVRCIQCGSEKTITLGGVRASIRKEVHGCASCGKIDAFCKVGE